MTELVVRWKNGETAIYRFTTKGDAVVAKMIFENHCKDEIKEIKINVLEQQPSEDCISKVEAINRIEVRRKITCESDPYNYEEWTKGYEEGIDDAIAMINSVPSVTPERPKGKRIKVSDYGYQYHFECSACRKRMKSNDDKYCPNCGAEMENAE